MIDAKCKKYDTGYDLNYEDQYLVSLIIETPLYDKNVPCDFFGWNDEDLEKHKVFHWIGSHLSRFKGKKLFTLVGEIGTEKIDLGFLWYAAKRKPFVLHLRELSPNKKISGRLFVYLNDVNGFYRNNSGSYDLQVESI